MHQVEQNVWAPPFGGWMFGCRLLSERGNLGVGQLLSIQLLCQQSIIYINPTCIWGQIIFSNTLHFIKQEFLALIQLLFRSRKHHLQQQNNFLVRIPFMDPASISVRLLHFLSIQHILSKNSSIQLLIQLRKHTFKHKYSLYFSHTVFIISPAYTCAILIFN